MDWSVLLDSGWVQAVAGGLLGLIGLIAGTAVARTWGYKHAYELGIRIASVLPDAIEDWLAEFLRGVRDGLNADNSGASLESRSGATSELDPELRKKVEELAVNVKDRNPFTGQTSSR